ncbi:asparagine synthetase B family protein [Sinorhizobium meliloti]|uniref:asparagine synthetase B family protein n=1 Tax=Rhizobium meliloti TaxID=382 RepID=UPI001296E256|nr:asparagine synthase-related protein [Sinorhizobium meliloti]MQW40799.1 hypothetical protein [Sinorhizobium meliloti]
MSGFVGFLGAAVFDLKQASCLLSHRGSRLDVFEDERGGIAVLSENDTGLFKSEHVAVAVSGTGCDPYGHPLSALRLADEYRSSGTIEASAISGTFSFAILDTKAGQVLLCRDAIGANPLHVIRLREGIYFASEYKALLAVPGLSHRVDVRAVNHFLSTGWNIPGTTFFSDIQPVQPGRLVTHTPRATIVGNPVNSRIKPDESSAVTSHDLLSALNKSVDSALSVSGPNIGMMLSGGIDSALIAALLKRKVGDRLIRSFTVGYGEDDPEIRGARETASTLGLEHHELILSLDAFDKLVTPAIWTMENACGFDEYPCLYGLLQSVKGTVDTVFSGNFSDTVFAGMATHRKIWEADHGTYSESAKHSPASSDGSDGATDDTELVSDPSTYPALSRSLTEELSRALTERDERMSAQEQFVASIGAHFIMPYTHPAVIDVALRSTDAQKLSVDRNKLILRDAASQVLPRTISERQKHIQQMPYDLAMQEYLIRQLDEIITNHCCLSRRYIRLEYLLHARSTLRKRIGVASIQKSWNIIAFEHWCRVFLVERRAEAE